MIFLSASSIVQDLLNHFSETAFSTVGIVMTLVLPVAFCCTVLYFLAQWQNRWLMKTFGWKSMLVTGWLGTPIHELSHALAALVFCHKLKEVSLFKPNPSTGQLGHVKHVYNPKNPYAAVLGNSVIPMAPFFGGTAAILVLTYFLVPEFTSRSGYASGPAVSAEVLLSPANYRPLLNQTWSYVKGLVTIVRGRELWTHWQFYLYLYTVFCVAMHLAPSKEDFKNFWTPVLVLFVLLFLVNFVVRFFGEMGVKIINYLSSPILALTGILTFTIVVSLAGAALVAVVTFLINRLKVN